MGQCCSKNQMKDAQLESGVVKIQAQFRGAKTRKKLREEQQKPEKENSTKPVERMPSLTTDKDHLPSSEVAVPVEKMPLSKNPGLKMIAERKGPFKFDQDPPEISSLPCSGPLRLQNGVFYEGQWKNGKRNGRGKQIWKEGSIYEGYFVDDKANGKGRLVHANGEVYEGDWVDGLAEGNGELFKLDGSCYQGEFKNDKQVHFGW